MFQNWIKHSDHDAKLIAINESADGSWDVPEPNCSIGGGNAAVPSTNRNAGVARIARYPDSIVRLQFEKSARLLHSSSRLGFTQPEVSQIANGRLSGFTFDRLYRCLQALDMDIEITVRKPGLTNNGRAGIHVLNHGI